MSAPDPVVDQDALGRDKGLPGVDPREADIDRSAVTELDAEKRSGLWGIITSDAGAVWTARILSLVIWQLVGMAIDRIPTPIQVFDFLIEHSDLLLPNIWVTVQTALDWVRRALLGEEATAPRYLMRRP